MEICFLPLTKCARLMIVGYFVTVKLWTGLRQLANFTAAWRLQKHMPDFEHTFYGRPGCKRRPNVRVLWSDECRDSYYMYQCSGHCYQLLASKCGLVPTGWDLLPRNYRDPNHACLRNAKSWVRNVHDLTSNQDMSFTFSHSLSND